ncbi:hypothetical protein N431DRAFT_452727 [Stipitochalara longipes BDJ]|nr:hypothetical protein N431DRAFT_452727 [Stipitochalara longipes BDJ]
MDTIDRDPIKLLRLLPHLIIVYLRAQCINKGYKNRKPKSESEARKKENKAKLKALSEEYDQLYRSVDSQEERYALDEARFQALEAHAQYMKDYHNQTLEEKAYEGSARSNELHSNSMRRHLILKRIWLDIEHLKREVGSFKAWWYLSVGNYVRKETTEQRSGTCVS